MSEISTSEYSTKSNNTINYRDLFMLEQNGISGGDLFSCLNSSVADYDNCTCNISRDVLNIDLMF